MLYQRKQHFDLHKLPLPVGLNSQSVGALILGGQVHVNHLMLLVDENKVMVLLCPHADTKSVVLMLLVEFLRHLLCDIVNVVEHNESVPSRLNTLPCSLQHMRLMELHHLPRGEALPNHTLYPLTCLRSQPPPQCVPKTIIGCSVGGLPHRSHMIPAVILQVAEAGVYIDLFCDEHIATTPFQCHSRN
jgi:hypothetical protein